MKFLKTLPYYFLIFLMVFGLYSMFFVKSGKEIPVNFHEMTQIVEKNKDKEMTMKEKEDGTVILHVDNTYYTTSISPNNDETSKLASTYKNLNYLYQKDFNFSSVFVQILFIGFLIFMISSFFRQRKGVSAIKKGNATQKEIPNTTFDQVGGLSAEVKGEVKQAVNMLKDPKNAALLGAKTPKGILLYGPPGTGKTLLAKAIANALGANFYSTSGSSFMELYVGVGASRVRELFSEARKNTPAVVFIDEIDSVAKKRGMGMSHDEREGTLNEILAQLDGIDSNEGVFFVAATNRKDMLDDAFLRPGRMDYHVLVSLPDRAGREEIIAIHTKGKKLASAVMDQLGHIADITSGFSGADLENLFNMAARHASEHKKREIDMDDMNYAYDRTILGSQSRQLNDPKTKRRVAVHEAGHALVGVLTNPGSVRKATIIPRGDALGYVAPIPNEMHLETKTELVHRIQMILAGGVAEKMIYGEHSIGVGGDVQQAKQLIENMVSLGMKGDDFVLLFDEKDQKQEMQVIYNAALQGCKETLEQHREVFDNLVEALLTRETLTGVEVEILAKGEVLPDVTAPQVEEETKPVLQEKPVSTPDPSVDPTKKGWVPGNA